MSVPIIYIEVAPICNNIRSVSTDQPNDYYDELNHRGSRIDRTLRSSRMRKKPISLHDTKDF